MLVRPSKTSLQPQGDGTNAPGQGSGRCSTSSCRKAQFWQRERETQRESERERESEGGRGLNDSSL